MKKIVINKKFKIISVVVMLAVAILIVTLLCVNFKKDTSYNLSSYKMELSFNDEQKTLTGTEEVTFVNNYDNMFTYLYLHLYPNAFREGAKNRVVSSNDEDRAYPNNVSYGNITIKSVSYEGQDLTYAIEGEDENILKVDLPCQVYPEESITFSIEFEVKLANINHRLGYGNNTINLGNFYPIICVYESGTGFKTDLYHSNGDPFYSECANYDVTISYPSNFMLASSGNLISSAEENNITTSVMKENNIRDFCLVLSDIFQHSSVKVGNTVINYYGYTNDKNLEECLSIAEDALTTFNSMFGQYPYSQLSVVKANFLHGGMEYPNLVLISDDIAESDLAYVIVHEIAHQWWYGVVGNDEYSHAWMDEGLAEYSTLLFFKENENYNENFSTLIENATQSYKTFVRVYQTVTGEVDTSMNRPLNEFNTEPEYVQCTYTKGLLMFDTIREMVGGRKFIKALKKYYEDFAYKNASPAQMVASFIKSTGYDLEDFFASWLNGEVVIQ